MSYLLAETPKQDLSPVGLPNPPTPPAKTSVPLIGAVVPVVGAVIMFAITKSPFMLGFAALGPFMLVAGLFDRKRSSRRVKRVAQRELEVALVAARTEISLRHAAARTTRDAAHPALAVLMATPTEVWRAHDGRAGTVVVGRGEVDLSIDVAHGDERPEAVLLRAEAAVLSDAPIVIPLDGGVCIRGNTIVARAIARALLLQVCAVHPPGRYRVEPTELAGSWVRDVPHTANSTAPTSIGIVHSASAGSVGLPIVVVPNAEAAPAECRTVLELTTGAAGFVIRGDTRCAASFEAVSEAQAEAFAKTLGERMAAAVQRERAIALAECSVEASGTLGAVVGVASGAPASIDIVDDGPHAVVVGTTGSGKSEFLITWALALCRTYSPDAVNLMLADFKGGTAFAALENVPHVVGVLTDLNGSLARRAVQSLAAEVRRREQVIADAGARDILDASVCLARLVIMIDEFPALLTQHPDLEDVFVDIAARGRALGMHLVVGAQRSPGAIRDALLANMPLRIALRTSDTNDSRAVIGTDDAAQISGAPEHRGVGFVRRSGDSAPIRTRFALSFPNDVPREGVRPKSDVRPWLPPLPAVIAERDVPIEVNNGELLLGLADDPEHQRQPPVWLRAGERGMCVVGGPRSGKSGIALTVGASPNAISMPTDSEAAWDVLQNLLANPPQLLVCDDLDVLLASWPDPWQTEAAQRFETLTRRAGHTNTTIVITAQRLVGTAARIADLLPRRALLRLASRNDHVAAGGEPRSFVANRPVGRGMLDGLETQFVVPPILSDPAAHTVPQWMPNLAVVTGLVMRAAEERVPLLASLPAAAKVNVGDVAATTDPSTLAGLVVVGDPEQWQRSWHVADIVRRAGEFVIASDLAAEARTLTGDRAILPYALPGHGWLCRPAHAPARIALS